MASPSSWPSRITGRIPGPVPGRESALTRSGEPVERKMTEAPEPEDKLDAATTIVGVVNGPEDETLLLACERIVRRYANGPSPTCLSRMR